MVVVSELGKNGQMSNAMFQISCAIGYARKHNMLYLLPSDWKYFSAFEGSFNQTNALPEYPIYKELRFAYDEIPYFENVDLSGYWQSKKYWEHCEQEIRAMFKLKLEFELAAKEFINVHSNGKTPVSCHVRRTDYVSMSHYFHNLSVDWYREAMSRFDDTHQFFVMSDDIDYCKQHFTFQDNISFCGFSDVMDFAIGVNCSHNIVANSSFSWWQQFLNTNPNKIVIAPKKWFAEAGEYNKTDDLYYPNTWTLI